MVMSTKRGFGAIPKAPQKAVTNCRGFKKEIWSSLYHLETHTIHVWYIYLHGWLIFMVDAGEYTSPMDPMGKDRWLAPFPLVLIYHMPFTKPTFWGSFTTRTLPESWFKWNPRGPGSRCVTCFPNGGFRK